MSAMCVRVFAVYFISLQQRLQYYSIYQTHQFTHTLPTPITEWGRTFMLLAHALMLLILYVVRHEANGHGDLWYY